MKKQKKHQPVSVKCYSSSSIIRDKGDLEYPFVRSIKSSESSHMKIIHLADYFNTYLYELEASLCIPPLQDYVRQYNLIKPEIN